MVDIINNMTYATNWNEWINLSNYGFIDKFYQNLGNYLPSINTPTNPSWTYMLGELGIFLLLIFAFLLFAEVIFFGLVIKEKKSNGKFTLMEAFKLKKKFTFEEVKSLKEDSIMSALCLILLCLVLAVLPLLLEWLVRILFWAIFNLWKYWLELIIVAGGLVCIFGLAIVLPRLPKYYIKLNKWLVNKYF